MGLLVVVGSTVTAVADDAYYNVAIRELRLVEGRVPETTPSSDGPRATLAPAMQPYVVVDGPGEGYAGGETLLGNLALPRGVLPSGMPSSAASRVFLRGPRGKDIVGRVVVPQANWNGMVVLRFRVPASAAQDAAKTAFYQAKTAYYDSLVGRGIPGGAWFRHEARLARTAIPNPPKTQGLPVPGGPTERPEGLMRTYDLFTGCRAISENLQLDRDLPHAGTNETPVKVASLPGIMIDEIDWKPLLKDARPKLDGLAGCVPADQHVVFFPSFAAAWAIADEAAQHDTPVLRLANPCTENARVVERYQTQLGLSRSGVARLLGPQVIQSVALTGSDPFFASGTDVAVLFESPGAAGLEELLAGQIALAAAAVKEVKPLQGEIGGVKYRGFVSPDRTMSSYLAHWDGVVVVSNSLYQLGRLAEVRSGKAKAIASLPEYLFFRTRYPLGDVEETALVFLSDPTIRRWDSPRWRIADSRRTRARAVLAELQASQLDSLVRGRVKPGPLPSDLPILGGGELTLTPAGVRSSTLGSLEFMTPVAEIPLDEVTKAEAEGYRAWRDAYQQNGRSNFDPIALRLRLGKQQVAADLTVMPLILNSVYNEYAVALGGKLDPTAGDPHNAVAQLIVAIQRDKLPWTLEMLFPLGWIGRWATVYADDDPFWKELEKVGEDQIESFLRKNAGRIPVAAQIDVDNAVHLSGLLSAVCLFNEKTAPGLLRWESRTYKDQPYTRVAPARKDVVPSEFEGLSVCYTGLGGVLTITPNQAVLERAIDRWLDRQKAAAEGKPDPANAKPWLGANVAFRVDRKILEIANAFYRNQYQQMMQMQCWDNLPILNQWKRLYPDRDPVKVHAEVWGVELLCPGGGKYVWNEQFQTMASTVYGHPGEPKEGPPAPPVLSSFQAGDFGLTFENQGLRARVQLKRQASTAR